MSTSRLPVARRWFESERVDDGLTLLREPAADPWVRANTWHLAGRDRDLVIDTGYDVDAYELVPVVPTRRLADGDLIDLGDRVLHALHLPGHTPGSIGLYDPAARILFSGDAVYDPPDLLDELSHSSIPDYRATMRRLLSLDVDRVYAGHGNPVTGPRLREIATAYLTHRSAS